MNRFLWPVTLWVALLVLVACGQQAAPAEPETVEVPVEVTRIVEVEGTPQVETVTEMVVVTATPEPAQVATFESPNPDTFIAAVIGDAEGFDPALVYDSASGGILENVYETLVTYDRNDASTLVPQLAESWEISDDGTTYTFTLREGVTFHEGGELTAEDVAYSFQRGLLQGGPDSPQLLFTEPFLGVGIYDVPELIDPALSGDPEGLQAADSAQLVAVCEQVKEAIQADGNTVTMTLAQPWAPFLPTLAGYWGSVMDMEWVVENGGWDGSCDTWQNFYGTTSENSPFTPIANGTGPYMLERWDQGQQIVLTANENYWRTEEVGPAWEGGPIGPPAISQYVEQIVPEWGTRFAMLQAGDADTANVPRENIAQVDPLVGELCTYNSETLDYDCAATDNPDGQLRLYQGHPLTSRTDAMFVFEVNAEGGNPFIGSGQLDGNGIPPDFFSDEHVRKAFNYCFDWEVYIEDALAGEAVQNVGYMIPGHIGYEPDGPTYSYDPDACAEELAQAWDGQVAANGFRMQVAYNTGNATRQTIAEILQANIAEAAPEGVEYTIETIGLPWPNFLRQTRESRLPLFISGWGEDYHDPHNWAQPFLSGTIANRQNLPEETIAEFTELVNAGVAATDPDERAAIYQELTQLDYDNAIAIRLAVPFGRRYEQRWVEGWFYNPGFRSSFPYALNEKQ